MPSAFSYILPDLSRRRGDFFGSRSGRGAFPTRPIERLDRLYRESGALETRPYRAGSDAADIA